MPVNLDITAISGTSPFDIYLCDTGFTSCVYIDTITTGDLTYTFSVPSLLINNTNQVLKVVDDNGCIILKNFSF
jgi:hypothetical protein